MSETKANRKNRLTNWANNLTDDQAMHLIVQLVSHGMDCEDIRFWDDALAPYWAADGEPLVAGQKCYADD